MCGLPFFAQVLPRELLWFTCLKSLTFCTTRPGCCLPFPQKDALDVSILLVLNDHVAFASDRGSIACKTRCLRPHGPKCGKKDDFLSLFLFLFWEAD